MEISFARIALLMKRQFIENKKLYLFGVLAMMGIMSLVFLAGISEKKGFRLESQAISLGIGLTSFGCLFSLTLFSKLDNAKGRAQIFMLPATTSEKMLCAIIYGVLLFPVVYLATVYPLLSIANYFDNNYLGHFNEAYVFNSRRLQTTLLSAFYVIQALVLLCSVLFRQYKIVKSVVLICGLFFGTLYIYPNVINQFLPSSFKKELTVEARYFDNLQLKRKEKIRINETVRGRVTNSPFQAARYLSNKHYLSLDIPSNQKVWFYILLYLSIPFMWLITWLRLKESEIN